MDKLVTLALVERLKNSDFILESKMEELMKIKIQNIQIDQMLCEDLFLPLK